MARIKQILKTLFCLPPAVTMLIAIPSFALVIYVLSGNLSAPLVRYLSYLLSAYSLIITITALSGIISFCRNRARDNPAVRKMLSHPLGERFLRDEVFRVDISLYRGLFINGLYAAVKLASGIYYRSLWFGSVAGYYVLLAVMRFLLLRARGRVEAGMDIGTELRRSRLCGVMLLLTNQALTVMVVIMIFQDRGYEYPGMLIYAMAVYTFYAVITAIVNMLKFSRHKSPVLSAAKTINLTVALVSMLSLTTAMLAQFGGDDPVFRRSMTACVGSAVCVVVLGLAVYMIVHSTKQLRRLRKEADGAPLMGRAS